MSAVIRKPKLDQDWKKKLSTLLKDVGLIDGSFTGKLNLHIATGGVAMAVKEEAVK